LVQENAAPVVWQVTISLILRNPFKGSEQWHAGAKRHHHDLVAKINEIIPEHLNEIEDGNAV
jgi:hypothetical protein